jgi:hypothetical protein
MKTTQPIIQIEHLNYPSKSAFVSAQALVKKSAILGRLLADDDLLIAAYVLATHPDSDQLIADGVAGIVVTEQETPNAVPYRTYTIVRADKMLVPYTCKHLRCDRKPVVPSANAPHAS